MRYSSILILCLLLGCTSEITLDQEEYLPKIVVDGWIEPDKSAIVFLTLSSPFLTQYDSASVVKTFLNHAKITIKSSLGETEVLTLFRDEKAFPPFYYKSIDLVGVVGQSYTLEIAYQNKIITSLTSIPEPPKIQSATFIPHTESEGSVIVRYFPQSRSVPYYFFRTATQRDKYKFFPVFYPLQTCKSVDGTNEEYELFSGRKNNIDNSSDSHDSVIISPRYYWINDSVLISVSSIDSQSFEVLNSIFSTLSNYDNPFTISNPELSNIEGGIGRWTGLGTTTVQFILSNGDSIFSNN